MTENKSAESFVVIKIATMGQKYEFVTKIFSFFSKILTFWPTVAILIGTKLSFDVFSITMGQKFPEIVNFL